ncbi:hypothetical protein EDB86DRAFT_2957765 [Lactarius hatsudake]|nr:hypothetical protein EDB86DRAFT_2957765 [Lactarius hatsudake]
MSTAQSPDYSAHIINGMHEVASHHIGKGLVDVFRNTSIGGKIRQGDYYLSRSNTLIQQYYAWLPTEDQDSISARIDITVGAKEDFDSANGSIFRRYSLAKEYRRVSKNLFKITETASRRAASKKLMAQISEAIAKGATEPPLGTTSTLSNPFSDTHEVSTPTDIDVDNLNEVEMSTFRSEATGGAVVVLNLHRDSSTQQVIATFPPEAFVGDGTHSDGGSASIYSGSDVLGPHSEAGDDAGR